MTINRSVLSLVIAVLLASVMWSCGDDDESTFIDDNYATADAQNGGLLYDKWWKMSGTEPTADFNPIWATQSANSRSGSDTWRCKECHGWDYKGIDGAYASGSHMTGFMGIWSARNDDKNSVFNDIKDEGGNHDLSNTLTDNDIADLTKFILTGLVDMSLYIDYSTKAALGDTVAGKALYEDTGSSGGQCITCHGADGKTIDIDGGGVGDIANGNPWETLHKIRFGHPGTSMPSTVANGLSDADAANILAYSQTL